MIPSPVTLITSNHPICKFCVAFLYSACVKIDIPTLVRRLVIASLGVINHPNGIVKVMRPVSKFIGTYPVVLTGETTNFKFSAKINHSEYVY